MRLIKHLGIVAILTIILLIGGLYALNIYTRHGKATEVPELKGLTVTEIRALLNSLDLRFAINDSVYNTNLKPGSAISQNPAAGTMVKKGRTIFLIMNAMEPEMVAIPSIVGISLRQAGRMLKGSGLKTGQLKYVQDIARNNVLEVSSAGKSAAPGELIRKGSAIDLTLGMGSYNERTNIPALSGKSYTESIDALHQSLLNSGTVIYDNTVKNSSDSAKSVVFRQVPAPSSGLSTLPGTAVNLWMTIDKKKIENIIVVPDIPEP